MWLTIRLCPNDPFPGFCSQDIAAFDPNGTASSDGGIGSGVDGYTDHRAFALAERRRGHQSSVGASPL